MTSTPPRPAHSSAPLDAAAFARRFTEAWAVPRVERLVSMLAPDVMLLQPVTPPVHGRDAAAREFGRLLRWLPDLVGVVDEWAATGDTVLIVWRLRFTLGGGPFEIPIVDRLVVRDDLIVEREAYFDSLRFFVATLTRPRAWLGYLRYRGYLPGGDA